MLVYEFHIHVEPHATMYYDGIASQRYYMAGVRAKVKWMQRLLNTLKPASRGEEVYVLFSDLDVLPLRPLSQLWPLSSPSGWSNVTNASIVFMDERHIHSGGLSNWAVNSGVYLLRNTARVRMFLYWWSLLLKSNRKLKDQDAASMRRQGSYQPATKTI